MPIIGDDPQTGSSGQNYIYLPALGNVWDALQQAGYQGATLLTQAQFSNVLSNYGLGSGDAGGTLPPINLSISGGGGGSSGPSAADLRNLRSSFLEVLHSWGIDMTNNLGHLVDQGVNQLWSTTTFMMMLRKTKEYKDAFPGIASQDGMTEAEYLAVFRQYSALGKDIGFNLDRTQFGFMLKKGIDYSEFSMRVAAIDRLDNGGPLFKNFVNWMKQGNWIKPNEKVKKKDLADLIMGRGSPQFEKAWERAVFETGLEQAGFVVGKGAKGAELGLTRHQMLATIKKIESTGVEVETATTADFQQLAQMVNDVFPLSQIYKEGITKSDLIQLQFGGPKAPKIAQKVQQLLATHQAFEEEERAVNEVYQTATGTSMTGGYGQRGLGAASE